MSCSSKVKVGDLHEPTNRSEGNNFSSYKTKGPIKFRRRWQRSWLIVQTLDPDVLAIRQYWPNEAAANEYTLYVTLETVRGEFRHVLLEQNSDQHEGDGVITVHRADVLGFRDLRFCQSLWKYRSVPVPIETRLTVTEFLTGNAPQSITATINAASRSGADVPTIAALICTGAIAVRMQDDDMILISSDEMVALSCG